MVDGEQVITNSLLKFPNSYGLNDLAKTFEVPESVAGRRSSSRPPVALFSTVTVVAATYERSDLFLLDGDGKVVGFAQTDDSGTGRSSRSPRARPVTRSSSSRLHITSVVADGPSPMLMARRSRHSSCPSARPPARGSPGPRTLRVSTRSPPTSSSTSSRAT